MFGKGVREVVHLGPAPSGPFVPQGRQASRLILYMAACQETRGLKVPLALTSRHTHLGVFPERLSVTFFSRFKSDGFEREGYEQLEIMSERGMKKLRL